MDSKGEREREKETYAFKLRRRKKKTFNLFLLMPERNEDRADYSLCYKISVVSASARAKASELTPI